MKKKLTPKEEDRVAKFYQQNRAFTLVDVGKRFGVSKYVVRCVLLKRGILVRKKGWGLGMIC
jgi:DNA-directed RNA polymerase sigma subunit (sigma70/sigma32)